MAAGNAGRHGSYDISTFGAPRARTAVAMPPCLVVHGLRRGLYSGIDPAFCPAHNGEHPRLHALTRT